MVQSLLLDRPAAPRIKPFSFTERLKEISMFFAGNDEVHQTMRRTADRLEQAGISYAILGGMAINAHKHQRTTGNVDFLLTADGLEQFRRQFLGTCYDPSPKRDRRFVDRENGISIDILVTGRYPGSGKPGPIAFPDPAEVSVVIEDRHVVNLATLVELKLAARRSKDFGNVVELIRTHDLEESYMKNLHSSVHADFIECLEEKRREDDYIAREG